MYEVGSLNDSRWKRGHCLSFLLNFGDGDEGLLECQGPGGGRAKGMAVFIVSPGHLGTKEGGTPCPGWKMPCSSEWSSEDSVRSSDVSLGIQHRMWRVVQTAPQAFPGQHYSPRYSSLHLLAECSVGHHYFLLPCACPETCLRASGIRKPPSWCLSQQQRDHGGLETVPVYVVRRVFKFLTAEWPR